MFQSCSASAPLKNTKRGEEWWFPKSWGSSLTPPSKCSYIWIHFPEKRAHRSLCWSRVQKNIFSVARQHIYTVIVASSNKASKKRAILRSILLFSFFSPGCLVMMTVSVRLKTEFFFVWERITTNIFGTKYVILLMVSETSFLRCIIRCCCIIRVHRQRSIVGRFLIFGDCALCEHFFSIKYTQRQQKTHVKSWMYIFLSSSNKNI